MDEINRKSVAGAETNLIGKYRPSIAAAGSIKIPANGVMWRPMFDAKQVMNYSAPAAIWLGVAMPPSSEFFFLVPDTMSSMRNSKMAVSMAVL